MRIPVIVLSAAASLAAISMPAGAQYVGPGTASSPSVKTILAEPKDDQWVTLQGNLLRKTGKERYVFSDGSGEIEVEIDDKDFPREAVDETVVVEITGEVDTGLTRPPEIEVDTMRIIRN